MQGIRARRRFTTDEFLYWPLMLTGLTEGVFRRDLAHAARNGVPETRSWKGASVHFSMEIAFGQEVILGQIPYLAGFRAPRGLISLYRINGMGSTPDTM
jgi:hypothetical protein